MKTRYLYGYDKSSLIRLSAYRYAFESSVKCPGSLNKIGIKFKGLHITDHH